VARTFLVIVATLALLTGLTGYQATTETAGERMLGRLFGALIEVDRWLPAHREDLEAAAAAGGDRGLVALPDFPIAVSVPAEAITAGDDRLRAEVLAASGTVLSEDGRDAFRQPDGSGGELSIDEPVRWAIDLLGSGGHGLWTVIFIVTAVLAGLIYLAAAASTAHQGLRPLFANVAEGALIFVAGTLVLRVLASLVGGDSAVNEELSLIARDVAWIGTRAGVALALIAGALLALSSLLGVRDRNLDPWPDAVDEPY
jgi:hypothetical protein